MTVHCEGDCGWLEQLGEKQDFEAELSRLGYRHEDFTLHVLRRMAPGRKAEWNWSCAVTVTNVITERRRSYQGGPGQNWLAHFSRDLANRTYGEPGRSGRPDDPGTESA